MKKDTYKYLFLCIFINACGKQYEYTSSSDPNHPNTTNDSEAQTVVTLPNPIHFSYQFCGNFTKYRFSNEGFLLDSNAGGYLSLHLSDVVAKASEGKKNTQACVFGNQPIVTKQTNPNDFAPFNVTSYIPVTREFFVESIKFE